MSTTTELPAAVHNAAARPGPFALLFEAIREVASRRRLIRYLVQAEIKKRGVNTVIGNLWWILDPILLMIVYMVLVSVIGRGSIPDYPLLIAPGMLPGLLNG